MTHAQTRMHIQRFCTRARWDTYLPQRAGDWGSSFIFTSPLNTKMTIMKKICRVSQQPSNENVQYISSVSLLYRAPHRGFYAGPVGYLSAGAREFGVAIRSALVSTSTVRNGGVGVGSSSSSEITLFAGAGIVPGSTARSEWIETGVKVRKIIPGTYYYMQQYLPTDKK